MQYSWVSTLLERTQMDSGSEAQFIFPDWGGGGGTTTLVP
jgi:hypothetical protein